MVTAPGATVKEEISFRLLFTMLLIEALRAFKVALIPSNAPPSPANLTASLIIAVCLAFKKASGLEGEPWTIAGPV